MARTKGMLNLSGNLEVNAQAPLDARTIVPTEADLTVANNFPYPYVGLEVYVTGTGKKFRLVNLDTTQSSSWQEIGEGGGGSGLPSGGTAGQYLVKQSATEGDADWQSLSAFTGATSEAAGAAGLVPAPAIGDEGKVLFGNGSWGNIVMPSVDLSNSSVESDILDTTEKAVGTTTDGYLIYQKVVSTGGSVPSGATLLMRVQLQNSTDIIRYTKTTDSPLASDEKFAGLTASGEVIYKKHYTSASEWVIYANSFTDTDIPASNVEKCIDCKGYDNNGSSITGFLVNTYGKGSRYTTFNVCGYRANNAAVGITEFDFYYTKTS